MFHLITKKFSEHKATIVVLGQYETLSELFDNSKFAENCFTDNLEDRSYTKIPLGFNRETWRRTYEFRRLPKYAIVTHNGVMLSLTTIHGERLKWVRSHYGKYIQSWKRSRSRGRRLSAYGSWRHPKTLSELRENEAISDLAKYYGVKVRAKRRHLPTVWDDRYSHNDKSWKTQSKRKHQWKPK